MGDDIASRVGWGIVLGGHAFDLEDWQEALKRPFQPSDPWVSETKDGLILRSSPLDSAATASEARERAKALMDEVNGAIRASYGAGAVRLEDIAAIHSDGTIRRDFFKQPGTADLRLKGRAPFLVLMVSSNPAKSPSPAKSNGGCRSRQTTAFSTTR